MALLEKFLHVKKSKISGSGLGLFTTENIPKGACIVEYKGKLEKWSEVKDQDGYNGYLLKLNSRWAINALPYKRAQARFANDAKGIHRNDNLSNNSEFLIEGKRCYIFAKREIRQGEEILVSYGREYWNLVKRIAKKHGK
ncbi:MAG: SET domain-containing protein-lysine N-methyltransferase [Cyclobacteriaceae bacterium]